MDKAHAKLSEMTFGHLLRLIREIAAIGVLAFLSIQFVSGELSLDFAKLSSTELVSLLLAFFSIALSASFYFAATNQSNQFYDNVNKFSKDTSELLGRLDEQVKGLGGRQSELKDSIDKYYLRDRGGNVEEAKQEVEAQAKEAEDNISKLVSEILDKTDLSAPERATYEGRIREKDSELSALRERIGRLASRNEIPVRHYTRRQLERRGLDKVVGIAPDELLFQLAKDGASGYRRDLAALGYIVSEEMSSPADVTESGKTMVLSALERALEQEKSS